MNAIQNKQFIQDIFLELSKGNDEPFIDAMAEEMTWIWMGSGQWSKTFDGKKSVIDGLWSAVRQTLVPPYKVNAKCFVADEDYVVVEAIGENITPDGKKYENKYCWVCRIAGKKIYELREYMDTDLVTKTFSENNKTVIGEKFLADFEMAKAVLFFQNETSLLFTIIEKHGKHVNETETVGIKLTEIRPNLYQAIWKEVNGNTIAQIQDFENEIVYSNWISPNGELTFRQGTLKPLRNTEVSALEKETTNR